jgi:hypothetical protein
MTFQQFPYNFRFWAYLGLLAIVITILLFFGLTGTAWGFGGGWSDNLDSYVDESNLNGQGSWVSPKDVKVSNDQAYSAPNGIKRGSQNDPYFDARGDAVDAGTLCFKFYDTSTADGYGNLFLTTTAGSSGNPTFYFIESGATFLVKYGGGYPAGTLYASGLAMNTWHTACVDWDIETDLQRIKINDLEYSSWFALDNAVINEVGGFSIRLGYADNVYFDDFSLTGTAPPEPAVWVDDPASATEITDLESTITVEWEGLSGYDDLYLTFKHYGTGITTGAKRYSIAEIGEEGDDLVIPLTDFNFTKNGNWYLYAIASYEGYLIDDGMFLSGYGSQFTDDLTGGNYYLDINIEGFEPIFSMSNFDDWYDENVDRFDAPTGAFSTMADFLSPIFSYIGEFGDRISGYFDNNDAYARGYDTGKAMPVFNYYVGQLAFFMGGFPLMTTFLIIVLIMVGIFIFRLVIRFIPHFGG